MAVVLVILSVLFTMGSLGLTALFVMDDTKMKFIDF